jgi:hypothetical protein
VHRQFFIINKERSGGQPPPEMKPGRRGVECRMCYSPKAEPPAPSLTLCGGASHWGEAQKAHPIAVRFRASRHAAVGRPEVPAGTANARCSWLSSSTPNDHVTAGIFSAAWQGTYGSGNPGRLCCSPQTSASHPPPPAPIPKPISRLKGPALVLLTAAWNISWPQ